MPWRHKVLLRIEGGNIVGFHLQSTAPQRGEYLPLLHSPGKRKRVLGEKGKLQPTQSTFRKTVGGEGDHPKRNDRVLGREGRQVCAERSWRSP